jgi:HK97 family phage portal protein
MAIWDFLSKKKITASKPLQSVLPMSGPLGSSVAINRGIVTWQGADAQSFVNDGYCANDIVYSIVKLITDKAKLAPFSVFKVINEPAAKKYKALMSQPEKIKNWKDVLELRTKAFEEYTGDQRLNELLKHPNDEDSFADVVEQWCAFKLVTGNAFVYGQLIEGGANVGKPLSINVLPAQYMAIIANVEVFPPVVAGYQLYFGKLWSFKREEILHDKYFNPQWNITGNQLYGQSPLKAASRTLTRSNEAKTAAVSAFQNGGPAGVLFMNDDRFDPISGSEQAAALKRSVSEKAGSSNFNQIAVSGYKVDWKEIGLSPVELGILESEKWDMVSLCNVYGVPSQLMNDAQNKTYNNQMEGEKALTLRCAIPLLNEIRDDFNKKLHTDWGYANQQDVFIDYDLTVYQELEANKVMQVDWLDKAWWLTPLQKYEEMGIHVPDELRDELNKIYIPSNLQALDTFQPIQLPKNIDEILNNK